MILYEIYNWNKKHLTIKNILKTISKKKVRTCFEPRIVEPFFQWKSEFVRTFVDIDDKCNNPLHPEEFV